ncbi:MAG TPA: hypothetical protein V6C97_34230 [Oculatellaceae cyanobacterium]
MNSDSKNQTSNASNVSSAQHMSERLSELQYAAMAHELSGLPVPQELLKEYQELEAKLSSHNTVPVNQIGQPAKTETDVERLTRQLGEMQYAAMAHALSGLPNDESFAREYEKLQAELSQAKRNYVDGLRAKLGEMKYTAMAMSLAGQDTPTEFDREYLDVERRLKQEEENN